MIGPAPFSRVWYLAVVLVSGCTVGPDYEVPADALVNNPKAHQSFTTVAAALSERPLPDQWWKLYDDARLDRLITAAFAANTNLRLADANLERSAALVKEAKTLQQPSIAVDNGIEYTQLSGEQYLLPVRPPVNTDYDAGITVGYDLDLFGGIRRGIEAAEADHQAVEAARDLVKVNVAAETTRAFADVCATGLQLAAAKHSLLLQQKNLSLTQSLHNGGRAIDLDITRSRQLVDQLATAVPELEAAQRNASFRLATLTSRVPGEFDATLEQCATPPRILKPLPVGDGASLLKRRPDIREAERQLAAATAEIGVATAELYPDIQIGISGGSAGAASDFFTGPTNFWSLGGQLKWQANQSAARAKIEAANAGAKMALAHFDGVVLEALRETESALNSYVHDLQREQRAKAARDDAAKAADESHRLELGGRATALAVLDAERTLAAAEQSLAEVESAISADHVGVFLALGGGWETPQIRTASN
jgi:NodT family efflux transporter outer membrane factor (OMF) lipoprotein